MSFATRLQSLVTRLTAVDRLGNSATFSHPNETYDRATGKVVVNAPPTTLATTIGGPIGVNPKLANGTTVQESDQVIYAEASQMTFTIVPGQTRVTINTKVYAIVSVEPYRVNDTDVAFKLMIR